jgi:hypothetical protein
MAGVLVDPDVRLFRRPRTLGDHLFQGVAKAIVLGIGLEVAILTTAAMQDAAPGGSGPAAWSQVDQPRAAEVRLMQRFACSTDGYGDDVIPRSAIIRDDATGGLKVVSFARGWEIYTSDRAGLTLVAVCLKPRR